jgi:gamma-glutamyltranspeptidase/glutathione hydrolase
MRRLLKILSRVGLALLLIALILGAVYQALPNGPRDPMTFDDPWHQDRPMLQAASYAVAAGTPWATQAAVAVLDQGGNAFDAAAAALLVLNVTHGEAASFPGIAPLVLYDAKTGSVHSYIGAGTAPAAATLEKFTAKGYQTVPDINIWAQLLPASPDVIVSLLEDYGSMSFAQVAAEAIRIGRQGFPVHEIMYQNMDLSLVERIGYQFLFPYNVQVYLGGQFWRPLYYKDRFKTPDLANTLQAMSDAETAARQAGGDRQAGLQAVRDYFYTGPLSQAIVKMHQEQDGLFTASDLADYKGGWETPVQGSYGEYTFYTNSTWSQGAVTPLTLQILDGIDLKSMGHNSPQYVHTVAQAIELAMADREAYMADPAFVQVPLAGLMSPAYAAQRRAQMTGKAFGPLPPPGQPEGAAFQPALGAQNAGADALAQTGRTDAPAQNATLAQSARAEVAQLLAGARIGKDTTQLAIVDVWGNAIAITPSDFPKSPMVPGTGLTLGDRMTQFRLDPNNVDALAPGKRPRVTPHAVIVLKNGQFYMAINTPGDDMQPQALVQVFLNMAVFGMDIQSAIDAPRFRDMSMPASFAPHEASPGTLLLESSLYDQSAAGLQALGYTVTRSPDWDNTFGAVGAVLKGGPGLLAGSDPREEGIAAGK